MTSCAASSAMTSDSELLGHAAQFRVLKRSNQGDLYIDSAEGDGSSSSAKRPRAI